MHGVDLLIIMGKASLLFFIFCVLLVLVTAEFAEFKQTDRTYYVQPMPLQHNLTCPGQPCLTISGYARESESYFLSNSTFIFMPGNHTLDTQLRIRYVSNIVLHSVSQADSPTGGLAQITCTNNINIWCMYVSGFSIFSLTITACGISRSTNEISSNSNQISIINSNFSRNRASALGIYFSYVHVTNCTFLHNTARFGGAILAQSNNLRFSSHNNFTGNSAEMGGAIVVRQCNVYITGISIFTNNFAILIGVSRLSVGTGGAVAIVNSTVLLTGENSFHNNAIVWNGNTKNTAVVPGGGAVVLTDNSSFIIKGTTVFTSNISPHSGAIYAVQSTLLMNATVTFDGNNAYTNFSGAITIIDSLFASFGKLVFLNNMAVQYGGAISTLSVRGLTEVHFLGSTEFSNNSAITRTSNGGAVVALLSSITMSNVVFKNNSIPSSIPGNGGIIFVGNSSAAFSGTNVFISNVADFTSVFVGDTSNITFSGSNRFENNVVKLVGSGAIMVSKCNVAINGNMTFLSNQGVIGGAILAMYSNLQLNGNINFTNNVAQYMHGGSISSYFGSINLSGYVVFINNRAQMQGGAVYAEGSRLRIKNTIMFVNNSAQLGGALAFSDTTLTLVSPINIHTLNNRAHKYGGVIYQDDIVTSRQCIPPPFEFTRDNLVKKDCFLYIESDTMVLNASILFQNDTTGLAGTVMYGGLLDMCRMQVTTTYSKIQYVTDPLLILSDISTIQQNDNSTSIISSDPFRLCFCENCIPDCELKINVSIVSGQQITLSVLSVGQFNMSVPTTVTAVVSKNAQLDRLQRFQETGKQCTTLQYRIFSSSSFEELILYPNGPCRDSGIARQVVNVTLLPCPDGFALSGSECVCEERLCRFTTNCTIGKIFSVVRSSDSKFWMDTLIVNGTYKGLILSPSCPFDYCVRAPIAITLDDLDIQCDLNRTGTLCGACQTNLSSVFGSFQCLSCSNYYLFLIIPFALAGVLLVILLLGLRLTVASGTLNGLILYANVVQVNRHVFFPTGLGETNVLTVFIAWLNLDLGIETCFYDGMDAYARTWYFLFIYGS